MSGVFKVTANGPGIADGRPDPARSSGSKGVAEAEKNRATICNSMLAARPGL